ncbi:uncharacterized protein LOC101737719 [Bombyx mori]|uniref:C2H2-type domain-containing protein n=1 Tax=Bombyx mori TaxID=7091 RepID=A0A8R2HQD4_BOMMO|nr:uncharacterized protein LOC101737719 [Bombyx mori]XP_021202975.1 uncharacterized protein LOC101737719 [Bombyx mori]
MKKRRKQTTSDSEDELPLTKLCSDANSYKSLTRNSIEVCEFCDKVFKNRYKSIIHTMTHITIPLIKDSLKQCLSCKLYFPSQDDLKCHVAKKHIKIDYTSFNGGKTPLPQSQAMRLESNVKLEPFCFDNKESNGDVKLKNLKLFKDFSSYNSFDQYNNAVINNTRRNIKSRILFEDEEILSSLDSNYQENIICKEDLKSNPSTLTSVHYDELIEFGRFDCKFCNKIFYSRYDKILHDTSHISLSLEPMNKLHKCLICERYITTTMRKHILEKHQTTLKARHVKSVGKKCYICHLVYYNKERHRMTSHHKYHLSLSLSKKHNQAVKKRIIMKNEITTMKLCELCYVRGRSKSSVLKNISELNKQCCDKCKEVFFEGKLVRVRVVKSCLEGAARTNREHCKSNQDRLKNIQNRLKIKSYVK